MNSIKKLKTVPVHYRQINILPPVLTIYSSTINNYLTSVTVT